MKSRHALALCACLCLFSVDAHAESLRCEKGTVSEGDSRLSVAYKCGQPTLGDSHCAPVHYSGSLHPVPEAVAGALVPCLHVEEWLYERGPGTLVAVVRMRGGKVSSISYGRQPR